MKSTRHILGVAIMLVMVATSSIFGQTFVGVSLGTTLAGSSREDVSSYGEPSRTVYGARFVTATRKGIELVGTLSLRQEEGGFVSPFVRSAVQRPSGKVNVVDNPASGPVIVSSLQSSSVELSAALRIPLAQLDSSGSYLGLQLGALADYLTSADQVDDYTGILQGDRGQIPDRVATSYSSQFGGGVVMGAALVLKTGVGRLIIDMNYVLRQPETLPVPNPRAGIAREQYVGWLVGNGLRLAAGFEFPL